MRIRKEDSFALLIDDQERLLPAMEGADALLENTLKLVQGLRIHALPILVTEQYSKGLGSTVAPLAAALGAFSPLEKTDFSAYSGDIRAQIDALGRKTVILFGIEAHVCVLQTVLDLREAGYQVFLVQDCIASRKSADRDASVLRALAEGALITSCESLLFELTVGKSDPNFKAISHLVK